jgi:hypothetical protein
MKKIKQNWMYSGLIITFLMLTACGGSGGGSSGGSVEVSGSPIKTVSKVNISSGDKIFLASIDSSSANSMSSASEGNDDEVASTESSSPKRMYSSSESSNVEVASSNSSSNNQLYTYNDDGSLEEVTFINEDGESIKYSESFNPTGIIDKPSFLIISFDKSFDYSSVADRTVIVVKSTGNAYLLGDSQIDSDNSSVHTFRLDYNPSYSFNSIHETEVGELIVYIDTYSSGSEFDAYGGFYKITPVVSGLQATLLFKYTYTCNNPAFLADKYGNFAYEDSCKPWKIYTGTEHLSPIFPDTFDYQTLITSDGRLVNRDQLLDASGDTSTTFTNNPITLSQSDVVEYGEMTTYIVTQDGLIIYNEADADPDTNVTNYFPNTDWPYTSSADFNDLLIVNDVAYIASNTGLVSLLLDGSNSVQANVLDALYQVDALAEKDGKIVFSGKDASFNVIVGEYDPASGTTRITKNLGKDSVIISFTQIN